MLYLIDTDTVSYVIRQRPLAVLEKMESVSKSNDISISAITYAELLLGAERSANSKKYYRLINQFCERLNAIEPWDSRAAQYFAKLQSQLFKKGTPIGTNDTMIAGHALSLEVTLVSNNQKHFSKVPKLKLENWV